MNVSIERRPHIMIHTCNKREWYVYQYLLPSLVQQGFEKDDIIIWHDYGRAGNLHNFLNSCDWIIQNCDLNDGFWHLQDDVVISKDFRQKTIENNEGIVCGFVNKKWNQTLLDKVGRVPAKNMWFSFQCIRIPNSYMKEFKIWMYQKAVFDNKLFPLYQENKHDDTFFWQFIKQQHNREYVMNLVPNIVDHIDYLLGGSMINEARREKVMRAAYWQDQKSVRELVKKLKETGRYEEIELV